tara:strand:- start:41 stop:628 length:588 start_codon:yes stop_codon:yes gene_type:complete
MPGGAGTPGGYQSDWGGSTSTSDGGDGAHLRRKTTFAPKTRPRPKPKVQTGITGQWDNFLKHRLNTQIMKRKVEGPRIPGTDEYTAPTYTHALGGYDWKQNFPNTPELLDKALAYGYQHLTEGTRALTDPTSYGTGIFGLTENLGSAFNKANVEAAKNIQGFTGEGISPEAMEQYQNWQNLSLGGLAYLLYGGLV